MYSFTPRVQPYWPFKRNVVVYEGPSMLNGERIFVIGTAQNANRKLGKMAQFWIVPDEPIDAVRTGRDAAVCGSCALRGDGLKNRACYVYLPGVDNIWQARAKAVTMTPREFATQHPGLQLRIGAYGDPVAVPLSVWTELLATAEGWTAYTHQWRRAPEGFKAWCMASTEGHGDTTLALRRGWRTFRVRPIDGTVKDREIVCPHETTDGRVQCDGCSLCRGAARPAKSIVVTVHGAAGVKWFRRTTVQAQVEA